MGRKGQAPEQIIAKLREAEVALAKGKTVAEIRPIRDDIGRRVSDLLDRFVLRSA